MSEQRYITGSDRGYRWHCTECLSHSATLPTIEQAQAALRIHEQQRHRHA